ncbi:CBS domain-containing protein [Streptomyces sp. 549]|uniref:CBS domain-containing protein n=1 Tax=Streptomyces sp. 549 TaxID=3049076 RepID=UPI0024C27A48|nr:CBS domain-containing protein [Streptomyces sp. 549]MDK1472241.1 CBS domain-containing protein [Streptomyces sp. 549]
MTSTVIGIGRDAPFKEIVRTLEEWRISALPVLEGESVVVGVVSEADLLAKEQFHDHTPSRMEEMRVMRQLVKASGVTAGELMTSPAVTVHADAPLSLAARMMAVHGVKRLPVTDDLGRLEGIVSRSDLLKVFLREDEDIAREVRSEVVELLFPTRDIGVTVSEGVVTLDGEIGDTSTIPVAARLARAVEGVVSVEMRLHGEHRRPVQF